MTMPVSLTECTLCPRKCRADRTSGVGFCGAGDRIKIARAARHDWEEPPISGKNGSGTIFFSGCAVKCAFCQNDRISNGCFGQEISDERFAEICFELKNAGVHNINLVTASHYAPMIAPVLEKIRPALGIPVVYNCGGYESDEILDLMLPVCDIFLPDLKFFDPKIAGKYASAPDYFEVAINAIGRMIEKSGKPVFDENGIMKSGTIVRHLILPGCRHDSERILSELYDRFGKDGYLLSLMSQYTPNHREGTPERRLTTFEYESVMKVVEAYGFDGFFQEKSSAKEEYTPDFSLQGVFEPEKV